MATKNASDQKYILSLDIGSTTISCFVYNKQAEVVAGHSTRIKVLYPELCGVELDPDVLWEQILDVIKTCLSQKSINAGEIASIGISTQRATFMLWDKATGKRFHNFIVWQDTRADSFAARWNSSYWVKTVQASCNCLHTVTQQNKFLAVAVLRFRAQHVSMRLLWLFQKYPQLKGLAADGKVCFGTLDTWIIWKLTKQKLFVSEYSCASATGLYDPYTLNWSGFVCGLLGIPVSMFPPIRDTSGDFGVCDAEFFGAEIPICSMVGDQQAAMFGECCFTPGDVKLTIGTGAFLNLNVGTKAHASVAGFYPVIGWKIGEELVHLAEGSSNTAGNVVDWLVQMKFIESPSKSEAIATQVEDTGDAFFVPCFNGIQAPINDYKACGSIMGLTQSTEIPHIVRAALESLAYRNKQLHDSLKAETSLPVKRFVCDGGVSENDFVVQLTADLIGAAITVPDHKEMSALGAAFLAGLSVGYWKDQKELSTLIKVKKSYKPDKVRAKERIPNFQMWCEAVKRSLNWYKDG